MMVIYYHLCYGLLQVFDANWGWRSSSGWFIVGGLWGFVPNFNDKCNHNETWLMARKLAMFCHYHVNVENYKCVF
jgi:hypothetical protein